MVSCGLRLEHRKSCIEKLEQGALVLVCNLGRPCFRTHSDAILARCTLHSATTYQATTL